MDKNISSTDDILGTLMLPLNEVGIISNFAYNYLSTLALNPRTDKISLMHEGKRISLELKRMGRSQGYISFPFRGRRIQLYFGSKKELADTILMIKNEFLKGESAWLDVKGRDVVDIGAYVGDTAINFLLDGARHVYAFEPYPYFYEIGKKNLVANRMQGKITMLNVGVAGMKQKIDVDASARSFSSRRFKGSGKKTGIEVLSLKDLVNRYKLKDAALKVDCEGYEYEIILNSDDSTLRRFFDMEIEYHYGYLNLERRLIKAGFEVEIHKPTKRFNFGTKSVMVNGFMHARRVER
ncbi:MAG: FkbM family methyltransferase [Candidatus Micrarchaeota archaeon]|nr:FkbM family methyltransferase [Candidatus Micrarchaeota archaeon]